MSSAKIIPANLFSLHVLMQSSKFAGSPKSEVSEIMFRTSETILVLVRSDY